MSEVNYLTVMLNKAHALGLYVDGVASDQFVIRSSPRGKRLTARLDVHGAIEWLDGGSPTVSH